jgi:hypothetical protein
MGAGPLDSAAANSARSQTNSRKPADCLRFRSFVENDAQETLSLNWEANVTKTTREMSSEISRRDLFKAAAGVAGAVAVLGLSSSEVLAAKMSKEAAGYQPTPKGGQTCGKCQNFAAPSACAQVEGNVSPNGWCTLFNAKA